VTEVTKQPAKVSFRFLLESECIYTDRAFHVTGGNHFDVCNTTIALASSTTSTLSFTEAEHCSVLVSPAFGERVVITSPSTDLTVYDSDRPEHPLDQQSKWFIGSTNTTSLIVRASAGSASLETLLVSSHPVVPDSTYLQGQTGASNDEFCGGILSPCPDLQSAVRQRCTAVNYDANNDNYARTYDQLVYYGCPFGQQSLHASCHGSPVNVILLPGVHNISAFGDPTNDIVVIYRLEDERTFMHLTSVAGPHYTSISSMPSINMQNSHFLLQVSNLTIRIGDYLSSHGCENYAFIYFTESLPYSRSINSGLFVDTIFFTKVFIVSGVYEATCQRSSSLVYGLPCEGAAINLAQLDIFQRGARPESAIYDTRDDSYMNGLISVSQTSFFFLSMQARIGINVFDFVADLRPRSKVKVELKYVSTIFQASSDNNIINSLIRSVEMRSFLCEDCFVEGFNNFLFVSIGIESLQLSKVLISSPGPIGKPIFNFILIWGVKNQVVRDHPTRVTISDTTITNILDAVPYQGYIGFNPGKTPVSGLIVIDVRCELYLQNVSIFSVTSSGEDFLTSPYHIIHLTDRGGVRPDFEVSLQNVQVRDVSISGGFIMLEGIEVPVKIDATIFLDLNILESGVLNFESVASAFISAIDSRITNCTFRESSAIIVSEKVYLNASITRLTFLHNTGASGVLLSSQSNQAHMLISNSSLNGNEADESGGITCCRTARVTFVDCHILRNRARDGGVLSLSEGVIKFVNSEIRSNVASREGAIGTIRQNAQVYVSKSNLTANRALQGGAFFLHVSSRVAHIERMLFVDGSELRGNNAIEFGGVVYVHDMPIDEIMKSQQVFSLEDCDISQNRATIGGGGVTFFDLGDTETLVDINAAAGSSTIDEKDVKSLVLNTSRVADDNTAAYGNIFASTVSSVNVVYPTTPQKSGLLPTTPFDVSISDAFGRLASSDLLRLTIVMYSVGSPAIVWQGVGTTGKVSVNVEILQQPNTRKAYVLAYTYNAKAQDFVFSGENELYITTQPCTAGQYISMVNFSFDGVGQVCQTCSLGRYSLDFERDDAASKQCRPCPANIDCSDAGYTRPAQNHWLRTNKSTFPAPCVPKITGCVPDSIGYCSENDRRGPMCLACTAGFPIGDGSCFVCGSNDILYTILNVLLIVCGVQLLHYLVHTEQSKLVSLARIFLTYLQMIFLLSSTFT